jgi:hypothetical protein
MSEHDDLDLGRPGETEKQDNRDPLPDDPRPKDAAGPQTSKELSCLPAIILPTLQAERTDELRAARPDRFSRSSIALAAAIAFAAFGAGAGALVITDHRRDAALLAEHAHETESLARTVDALAARLSAIDSAKAHDELIELRRSVGEIRSSSASSQELGAALGQLSQRVERLDREESAESTSSASVSATNPARKSPNYQPVSKTSRRRSSRPLLRLRPQARPRNRSSPRFRPSSARMSPWRRPVRSKGRDPCCAGTSCSEFATMSL